jgi:CHAD domain-containing protein
MKWIRETVAAETEALEGVRHAFVAEPAAEALHKVRTGARRLRSLLEDVATLHRQKRLLRRAKRTAECTDVARDAAVQRELLERMLDESERDAAVPMLQLLLEREAAATDSARRTLLRRRFETKGKR